MEGAVPAVYYPSEDFLDGGEARVPFVELFSAVWILTSICVGGVIGAEDAINVMEQSAGRLASHRTGTLPETDVVVNINVDVIDAPATLDGG